MPEPSLTPQPKVVAAGVVGGISVVVVTVAGLLGVDVPAEVAAAFATVVSFVAAYLKKNR